ncbi:MAG: hypothetical protein Q9220_004608 [cf. Caloplaca sp. 1 TL-2023]
MDRIGACNVVRKIDFWRSTRRTIHRSAGTAVQKSSSRRADDSAKKRLGRPGLLKTYGAKKNNAYQERPPGIGSNRHVFSPPRSDSLEVLQFRHGTDTIIHDSRASEEVLQTWIQHFLRLGKRRLLHASDYHELRKVARTLHNLDRQYKTTKGHESRKAIFALVETVRRAYVSGTIPATAQFPLHLLSYYKESGHLDQGIEFWKCLSEADDAILDPVYVGAAIELLAVYGAGIQYCEEVYERTMDQQASISSSYHLTPGAIVSDRSKLGLTKGTSQGLLQGILTARLYYSKWQSSLLTLDTAFRLRPSQLVPRILDLFVYERPIFEALPVFHMYCRGGNVISSVTFTVLLSSVKTLVERTSDYETKVALIRAMFHSVEAYVGSAGALSTQHLNILTSAMVTAMPGNPDAISDTPTEVDINLYTQVMRVFSEIIKYFARKDAPVNRITISGLIDAAVPIGQLEVARRIANSMMDQGHLLGESAAQNLMIAAMALKDAELLKTAWESICSSNMSDRKVVPSLRSWKILAVAARSCDSESLVSAHLDRLLGESHQRIKTGIDDARNESVEQYRSWADKSPHSASGHVAIFKELCNQVLSCLDRMEATQQGMYRNFEEHPLEGSTPFECAEVAEEGWQRRLYDELTLDKNTQTSQPSPVKPSDTLEISLPAISNTGVSFEKLRYLNWKDINNLLMRAERYQERLEMSTDAAIKAKRAMAEQRRSSMTGVVRGLRFAATTDQFEAFRQDFESERIARSTEEEWRNRILRLRDPNYETLHVTENTDVELPP